MEGKQMDASLLMFERLGVFADWKLPTDDELRFVAEDIEFNDIILGFAPSKRSKRAGGWEPKYPQQRIEERIVACRQAGLEPVVMPWAVRRRSSLDAMCDWLLATTDATVASLLDAEEDYYRGPMNANDAAQLVAHRLDARTWGATTITKPPSSVAALLRLCKFAVAQCYSFWKPSSERHWSHSRSTFPGPEQDKGAVEYRKLLPDDADLIMGLGCYWAKRPASGTQPALGAKHIMRFSAIETLALGILASWWWSLKWMRERGARGDVVRDFFGVAP